MRRARARPGERRAARRRAGAAAARPRRLPAARGRLRRGARRQRRRGGRARGRRRRRRRDAARAAVPGWSARADEGRGRRRTRRRARCGRRRRSTASSDALEVTRVGRGAWRRERLRPTAAPRRPGRHRARARRGVPARAAPRRVRAEPAAAAAPRRRSSRSCRSRRAAARRRSRAAWRRRSRRGRRSARRSSAARAAASRSRSRRRARRGSARDRRRLVDAPHRVSGRLCLVEGDARIARAAALRNQCALVIDVPHGADASEAASLADVTVLVAAGETEPALAAVVGASLVRDRAGAAARASAGRTRTSPWRPTRTFELPDARLASRIALAGREPPGALGAAIARARRPLRRGAAPMTRARARSAAQATVAAPRRRVRGDRGRADPRPRSGRRSARRAGTSARADLAAVSAARAMRDAYPRLFEPPYLRPGVPNPRHLERAEYLALARDAAVRRRARATASASTRRRPLRRRPARARARDGERARARPSCASRPATARRRDVAGRRTRDRRALAAGRHRRRVSRRARRGGGYSGPLAYRQGKPMRPDVAQAFDRMERAARGRRRRADRDQRLPQRRRAGARCSRRTRTRSGSRRPGTSLHRLGTELDLGPPAAYGWLAANAPRFGFVKRYAWEPWHFGYTRNAGSASVGFGPRGGEGRATRRRAVVRAAEVRAADRARRAALERRRGAARRADLRRVGLQPVRALARRRARHRPVHARHRARLRAAQPVRPGAGDRRAGAPDARPAAAVRERAAGAGRVQRGPGRGRPLRLHPAVPGDARLRGEDPRPARRSRRRPGAGAAGGLEVRLVE